NPKPETRNPKPVAAPVNPRKFLHICLQSTLEKGPNPRTRNPKPETRNPKPETRNPKPE
ncbi:hypothetical protein T484DRAFT_1583175, partial [Baffinella frigidus]